MARSGGGLAVHVGVDVLAGPPRSGFRPLRSGRDTVARVSRLCAAGGISTQRSLLDEQGTRRRALDTLAETAGRLEPRGLLVLTFSGHSNRDNAAWCLYDGPVGFRDLAA